MSLCFLRSLFLMVTILPSSFLITFFLMRPVCPLALMMAIDYKVLERSKSFFGSKCHILMKEVSLLEGATFLDFIYVGISNPPNVKGNSHDFPSFRSLLILGIANIAVLFTAL